MIVPTIGRIVWYHPEGASQEKQPLAAIISYVHSDTEINVAYFTAEGHAGAACKVQFVQGEEGHPEGAYCVFMDEDDDEPDDEDEDDCDDDESPPPPPPKKKHGKSR